MKTRSDHTRSIAGVIAASIAIAVMARASWGSSDAEVGAHGLANALQPIGAIVREEMQAGRILGAVVVVGHGGRIVYRQAIGDAAVGTTPQPMTEETVFDLASLTKVVATAPAVMQLVENGTLRLDDRVASYWPAFGGTGKESITVRQLLTHYSGLRPDFDLTKRWFGYEAALAQFTRERPVAAPGRRFIYSDINFIALGELVRRLTRVPLDRYCREHIFQPLGMTHTDFRAVRAAPTAPAAGLRADGAGGLVHDPTAARMGGGGGARRSVLHCW